jgi:sirohydrochlorin ferrochelatase
MASATETAVLLIGHGSRQAGANRDVFELAERIALRGGYSRVSAAFLELAEPDIATAAERLVDSGAMRVLLVPYFLGLGVHLVRDLAAACGELAERHGGVEFVLGKPLGPSPLLDDLVWMRIEELQRSIGG